MKSSSKIHFVPSKAAMTKMVVSVLLFLSICIPSFAYNLYVDASADSTDADGSFSHPYVKIQHAIDHAFNDSLAVNQTSPPPKVVIKVAPHASGYLENLIIDYLTAGSQGVYDVSIQNRSNNPDNCAIIALNSSEPVITVKGMRNSVLRVKGFGIRHSNTGLKGIHIHEEHGLCDTLAIENCVFENSRMAVFVDNSLSIYHLSVLDSKFISNMIVSEGILAHLAHNCSISYLNVKGCEFESTYSGTSVFTAISLSSGVRYLELSDNVFCRAHFETGLDVTGTYFSPLNIIAQNNIFHSSQMCVGRCSGSWLIEGNKFFGLLSDEQAALHLAGGTSLTGDRCVIKRNVFYNSPQPICVDVSRGAHYLESKMNVAISNNSFIDCGGVLTLYRLADMQLESNKVSLYRDNLYKGISGAPFTFKDVSENTLVLTGDNRIPVSYSHFSTALTDTTSLILDTSTVTYGDPHIEIDAANHTYSLKWDSTVRSPCINTGCPEIDGVPQTDPDGTPPDIGSVYYPHHHREYRFDRTPPDLIYWLSFPVLDDRSITNNQRHNELGYLFSNHMDPQNRRLESVSWSYYRERGDMRFSTGGWQNSDYQATQPKGFKIKFMGLGPIMPVVVDGFKADPNTTPVDLYYDADVEFENWIGYFVPYTQGVGDAFSRQLPNGSRWKYLDHIYSIKAQNWSTRRVNKDYGSDWIIDPNRYTVSEGDMLAIKLLPNAPEEMYWACLGTATPRIREMPQQFSYTEELDYKSIFIQFDPDNLPDEVGLMVAGECKGAAVVDSSLIEVNYYPTAAKSDDEIEILFYYGSKGMKKAPTPMVYNPETLLFEAGSLKASQIGDYGYISFSHEAGSSLVPLVTELKQNYPNPFRGNTTISWVMEKDEPVRIEIYNLRGQKVTTLYDGFGKKGRQSINWDARDAKGQSVASGVYFYRLSTPKESKVQKMMVIKH